MRACPPNIADALIAMVLLAPPSVSAQVLPQPGDRVRYWLRPCATTGITGNCANHGEGVVLSVTKDSIQLTSKVQASSKWLPVSDITRLEQFAGRRSAFWRGAAWGAAVGGTAGVVVGIALIKPVRCGYVSPCGKGGAIVAGGVGGAFYGALLGAIAGAIVRQDRWQPVLFDYLSVSLTPVPERRIALCVSRPL
jgi:hypothetical protein